MSRRRPSHRVLAAYALAAGVPVHRLYGVVGGARPGLTVPRPGGTLAPVHHAGALAIAALAAPSPAHVAQPYLPIAPTINYAQGVAPGTPSNWDPSAEYDPGTKTVYSPGRLNRFQRGHEAGHALDFQVLNDGDRNYFTRLLGLKGPWAADTFGTSSPQEVFADWYANAVVGNDGVHSWESGYAATPDPVTLRRFKQALARLGRRYQLAQYK